MRRFAFAIGLAVAIFCLATKSPAQLAPSNEIGLSWGHLHLNTTDVAKETRAWIALGGQLGYDLTAGANIPVTFPGILILVRKGTVSAGSSGSLIDHVAFRVADLNASLTKWRGPKVPADRDANWGLKIESGTEAGRAFVTTPAGTKIEMIEDRGLRAPIVFDHAHFYAPESVLPEIQDYFEKTYGAKRVKGKTGILSMPGGELIFSPCATPMAATMGRSLDHIGFNMDSAEALDHFTKSLQAQGAHFEPAYVPGKMHATHVNTGFGTMVELKAGARAYFDAKVPTDEYYKMY